MRLTIPQPNLAALIARGSAAVAKKSPLPILTFLRLSAIGDELAIASSDQDRFAEAISGATVENEGAVCVDAGALATLIGKHPKSGVIAMALEAERLVVTCGRSKVKLPTLKADLFPTWADNEPDATFALDGKDFERAFSRVRFAASGDETRYNLQGVHLDEHDGNLHFVATDSHRLAVSGMPTPDGAEDCPKIIVPSEGVDAALKVFKDAARVDVRVVAAKSITFSADGLRLASRLIDGTYPDYARIIPARGSPALVFKRGDLVDCLDRANVLVGEGALGSIVARPDGETLRLESRNHNGGEADEELAARIDPAFKPFGFNPKYFSQFLSTMNVREITVEQEDPANAHLFYSDDAPDFLGVLMPVRIAS